MAAPEPPAGAQLAHTHWGEPKTDTQMALTVSGLGEGVEPAPWGVPYTGPDPTIDRAKKCKANDDTCNGWRLKDSEYCAGHAGVLKPRTP